MIRRAGVLQRVQAILHRRPAPARFAHDVPRQKKPSSWRLEWTDLRPTLYVLQVGLFLHFVTSHIGFVARTIGPSMVPTISAQGDCVIVSRLHKRGRDVKVGDLVDFEHPLVPGTGAIKRVVGMPGDFVVKDTPAGIVMGEDGLLGRLAAEDVLNKDGKEKMMLQVPEGHCWILGDNILESRDSRTYGPLPLGLIKGKVIAKVWPLGEAKWFENNLQPVVEAI